MRERHSGTFARIVKSADASSYYNFEGGGRRGGRGGDAPIHSNYKRLNDVENLQQVENVGNKKVKRIGGKKRRVGNKIKISGINKRRKVGRKKKRFAAF